MPTDPLSGTTLLKLAFACKCPRCRKGGLYQPGLMNLNLRDKCPECGLALARNDNGDGPAVFLIWLLGITLVPLALLTDHLFNPPLWVIGVVFGTAALGLTLGATRPMKAYVLALQYKHRPGDWKQD